MDRPLSDTEISKSLDGEVRIVSYHELKRFKSIENLLHPCGRAAILYPQSSQGEGHWVGVLCYRKPKGKITVEVFDPYGHMPDLGDLKVDSELSFLDPHHRKGMGIHRAYLSELLIDFLERNPKIGRVEYNEKPFQKWGQHINTCGRWVIARLMHNNMSLKEFAKEFVGRGNKDKFVTDYTNRLFPFLTITRH